MTIANTRRKATPLHVPKIDHDPSERKRVLNVLAQRRYRRRKKEQVQALEREVRQTNRSTSCENVVENESNVQILSPISNNYISEMYCPVPDTEPHPGGCDFEYSPGDIFLQGQSSEMTCFNPSVFEAVYPASSMELPSLPPTPSLITSGDTLADQSSSYWGHHSLDHLTDFPDERNLPMLEINLLRATLSIAQRLKVDGEIWSLEALSPFHNSAPEMYLHLPINLRPTAMQLSRPHHPVFDILPWPSVREKLIMIFTQPVDMRPPAARSPTAMIDLVYDIEDPAEGIRIWGDDPHSEKNWEVGQKMFLRWWWALDSEILGRSNDLRRQRGAPTLTADRNRVIEEVE